VDLISRASVYYVSKAVPETDRALMRRIDELRLSYPFAGNRMLCNPVRQASIEISRKHVTTLMRRLGLEALHHKPVTSRRHPSHTVFPYLLQDLSIDCANQGWATDIPYIPMHRGLLYLTVVRNWASRRVLSFRLFNALSADFCCDTVEEALACYGVPDICNTDQGCQLTRHTFMTLLQEHNIQISMDARGAWRDKVFVERLWWTIQYEAGYLHADETVVQARVSLMRYFAFYNQRRPHLALDGQTPDAVYLKSLLNTLAA
jgi:putative transposase